MADAETSQDVSDGDGGSTGTENGALAHAGRGKRHWLGPLVAAVGFLILGGVVGWQAQDRLGGPDIVVTRPLTIASAPSIAGTALVPDVIGLDLDAARQVYFDAGIDPTTIDVQLMPYAGTMNAVVRQSPGAATELSSGRSTLFVAAPATVPNLIGRSEEAARSALQEMGARVVVKTAYVPGKTDREVVALNPAAGQPLREAISITVAEPLTAVYITQIRRSNADCDVRSAQVGGAEFDPAILCGTNGFDWRSDVWTLNKRVQRLEVVAGNSDAGDSSGATRFRIVVNGKVVWSRELSFGQTAKASINLIGAIQLRLESRAVNEQSATDSVWGEPRLLAGRTVIDSLREN